MAPCKFGEQLNLINATSRAKIPAKYAGKTFSDYKRTEDNAEAVQIALWYVAEMPRRSLYLYGECGTGKTFLASLIAQAFSEKFKRVIFGDVPSLLDEIKRTFNGNGSTQEIIDRYCESDLLVLDDLGAGQITGWNVGQLYQIVNRRYSTNSPIIVTSNFDYQDLETRLASEDKFSAKRIVSRLSEMCEVAYLGTNDRRRKS